MATAVHIPLSEYLQSSYEPDCDYVDGELQERHLGEQKHSIVQTALAAIFYANRRQWAIRPLTEQRIQVAPARYRIPDLCVVQQLEAVQPVLIEPPLLCVEILSPEDRFQRIVVRAQEYRRMGVANVWIIDPESREIWTLDENGGALPMLENELLLPGTLVRFSTEEIFEEIDFSSTQAAKA